MKQVIFLLFFLILCSCTREKDILLYDLKCEGLDQPTAIDSPHPHFSWKIKSKSDAPASMYQIQVASTPELLAAGTPDIWDSGEVPSGEQVMISYDGPGLKSRQICWWHVRIRQAKYRESGWSAPQRFGIGVLEPDSLRGEYIGAVSGEGRSAILRKQFEMNGSGTYILHVNSLGYHEVYVNGEKVGDAVLTPAVSQLDRRSLTVTYDITSSIEQGANEILLWTGSGWYKTATFEAAYEGALVKAELDVVTSDGYECVLRTDSTWTGAWSGYKDTGTWRSWEFGGEVIDARIVPQLPDQSGLGRLEWKPVDVVKVEGIKAMPQMCEPCRIQEVVSSKSIEACGDSGWVADMGQVVNGLCQVRLPKLPAGTEVKVSFCDTSPADSNTEIFGSNVLISSGREGGDLFTNKFNSHLFRYAVFENLPLKPVSVSALRMRTDYKIGSSFKCSDPELQSVYDLVARTMENLAFDGYMVDCASIERLGYGGDGNASTLSLQNLANVAPLYLNWLQAWCDAQREDGGLPHTAPCPYPAGGGPYWCSFIVQAPWRTYMSFGDVRHIERCYPAMKKWLEYAEKWSRDGLLDRWPDTDYRAWYLGDWLAPEGTDVTSAESVALVNNCALSQSYADMVKIAELLGDSEGQEAFSLKLNALNSRIQNTFYHSDTHTYGTGSQLDMAYPLLIGAVPESCRADVERELLRRTEEMHRGHIATGLVGVPVVTEWATLSRNVDFIYGMLKKKDYPGYLYMIENGATGVWESWSGRRSHLHNCYCGILSWFYQALGGIIPAAPGYREVYVNPQIPAGLDSVSVIKDTPYGPIRVDWKNTDGKPDVKITTPPGVRSILPE